MVNTNIIGVCPICLEELVPVHQTSCVYCEGVFHLRMKENVVAKDCGSMWLDEDSESLLIMCKTCQIECGVGPMGMGQ